MDYSYILSKKSKIQNKIKLMNKDFNIKEYWVNSDFNNDNDKSNNINYSFCGGDGSINKIDYLGYCLYGVGAISYIQRKNNTIEESIKQWDFDIISPYKYVSDRLRLYMVNMELKSILWNFKNKNIDYYLFDGSLYSLIIKSHTYMPKFVEYNLKDSYNYYKKEMLNKLYEKIENNDLSPIISEENNDITYNGDDEKLLLEQVEYIVLLVEILKKYKNKIIGISKTSKMNIYFEDTNMPDMAVFSNNVKNSGYSKEINIAKKIDNKNINHTLETFKNYYNIENLYYNFVKLDNLSGLINITSFEKLNNDFYCNLKDISVNGYPYLLKKSHDNVKISQKNMEFCSRLLGIYEEKDRDNILN